MPYKPKAATEAPPTKTPALWRLWSVSAMAWETIIASDAQMTPNGTLILKGMDGRAVRMFDPGQWRMVEQVAHNAPEPPPLHPLLT